MKYVLGIMAFFAQLTTAFAIVDMKNANYSDTWTFMEIPGTGYDLSIITTYNSRTLYNGIFGFGWCSDYETTLETTAEGTLKLTDCGAGQETIFFPKTATMATDVKALVAQIIKEIKASPTKPNDKALKVLEGQLTNSADLRAEYARKQGISKDVKEGTQYLANGKGVDIIVRKGETFIRTLQDGSSQRYDLRGKEAILFLTQFYDKNGNSIKLSYKGDLLTDIVDNSGRKLTFTYHANSRKVKEIVGPNKQSVEFSFKNVSDLVKAKAANGLNFSFEYDDLHNITKVSFPDNTTKQLTYDTNRDWVKSFKDRDGCLENYDYIISQDDPKNHFSSTVEKKCDGKVTNSSRFEFWYKDRKDGLGKFLEKVGMDVNGDKTEIAYHEVHGKPTMMKKNGKTTLFAYFENGLVKTKEFGKEITNFIYETKFNKVAQVKVGKKVTDFEYDNRGNLVKAKNTGGQIVKLEYDPKGRISGIEDQAKRKVKIGYEERFGKPKYVERTGVGSISVTYKATGEIAKIESDSGPSVAVQVASTFNNLLDVISPAGVDLGL